MAGSGSGLLTGRLQLVWACRASREGVVVRGCGGMCVGVSVGVCVVGALLRAFGVGGDVGDGTGRGTQRRTGGAEFSVRERVGLVEADVTDGFGGPGFSASTKRYPRVQLWEPLRERAMM